ncbi:MAG: glycosyltransferase [Aliidongia sp.]
MTSLLSQRYAGPLEIVLVDDHSSDGTADIARQAAQACNADSRLTIISARDLPPGWTGKLWAVSEGLAHAGTLAPGLPCCWTDADIAHGPDNVAQLVDRAEAEQRDLVSLMVKLRCRSLAERAFIPAFVFFFFMLYPPRWAADPKLRLAGAAGGCMLIRPSALRRIGGIAAIRGALIDDCSPGRRNQAQRRQHPARRHPGHALAARLRELARDLDHGRAHRLHPAALFDACC